MKHLPHTVLLAALLLSCAGDGAIDGPGQVAVATVDLEIGLLDGPEEYTFGRISGLALDASNRIYIADVQADEVQVFDPQGEFLFRIGGSGAGPGELQSPCCVAFDRAGRLWVRDTMNRRYNAYVVGSITADFSESRRMAHNAGGLWAPTTFAEHGELIDVGSQLDEEAGWRTVRLFLDSASNVTRREIIAEPPLDSLGQANVERSIEGGTAVYYFYQPHGARHLMAHSPLGGWANVVSSLYAVRWHGPNESFDHLLTRDVVGPLVTDSERAEGEQQLDDQRERNNLSRRDLPFGVPDRKAPIEWLRFDDQGRLWVCLAEAHGDDKHADVYGRTGEWLFTVSWPAPVDLRSGYLGDGVALGVTRDSLEVQRVVRLRFDVP